MKFTVTNPSVFGAPWHEQQDPRGLRGMCVNLKRGLERLTGSENEVSSGRLVAVIKQSTLFKYFTDRFTNLRLEKGSAVYLRCFFFRGHNIHKKNNVNNAMVQL